MKRPTLSKWFDPTVAFALFAIYVGWLLATASAIGYARDEGFYFTAADVYGHWFELLFRDPGAALDPVVRDQYWRRNAEHPALVKTLFALSRWLFFDRLGWFPTSGMSYRFVGMLAGGGTVGVLYLWGSEVVNRRAGLAAALSFALLPRVFFHSHLACFDVPVAFLWLLVSYAYYKALPGQTPAQCFATAVLFGLLLNTKHNSWLLPPVVALHYVLMVLHARGSSGGLGLLRLPRVLVAMLLVGPLVFFVTWPWLWSDTWHRLGDYVAFHLHHEYYNMEFLGRTYYEPPMPRLYAWLMTAATVPATVLALCVLGVVRVSREALRRAWLPGLHRVSASSRIGVWLERQRGSKLQPTAGNRFSKRYAAFSLWGLGLLAGYAPWWSSDTPIFGGTKHWITAYPFMALFAGHGLEWVMGRWQSVRLPKRLNKVASPAMAALILLPALVITWSSHPFGLSAYTPLVGGAPGAASLGLNRTFWGYTTGSLKDEINRRVAGGGVLYLHDTARSSFDVMKRDGLVRADITGTLDIARSDHALYHHEPHMRRVEYQIWVDYGTLKPSAIRAYHGVPVVWMYDRPVEPAR